MTELIEALVSWQSLLLAVVVFGFAPGFTLRLLVKIYPRDDPRRAELVAQLYVLGRLERPFFVAEQLETVLFEGLPTRIRALTLRVRAWTWPKHVRRSPMFRSPRYHLAKFGVLLYTWLMGPQGAASMPEDATSD